MIGRTVTPPGPIGTSGPTFGLPLTRRRLPSDVNEKPSAEPMAVVRSSSRRVSTSISSSVEDWGKLATATAPVGSNSSLPISPSPSPSGRSFGSPLARPRPSPSKKAMEVGSPVDALTRATPIVEPSGVAATGEEYRSGSGAGARAVCFPFRLRPTSAAPPLSTVNATRPRLPSVVNCEYASPEKPPRTYSPVCDRLPFVLWRRKTRRSDVRTSIARRSAA